MCHETSAELCLAPVGHPTDALLDLQTRLRWSSDDTTAANTSGRSLLRYAVLANDVEAVRLLLTSSSSSFTAAALETSLSDPILSLGERSEPPLASAMAVASWDLVETLLDARANPHLG